MKKTKTKNKKDVYDLVTDKIIEQLEKGVLPWKKPWVYRGRNNEERKYEGAYKRSTGISYSPLNQMLLSNVGEYASYAEWQKAGGQVKKGEKAEIVVFWKIYQKTEKTKDENGDVKLKKVSIPLLRYCPVFHISQVDGVEPKPIPDEEIVKESLKCKLEPCDQMEEILANYYARESLKVFDEYGNRAYYAPLPDEIHVPKMSQYKTVEEYYSTKAHETIHSTGHRSRLNRLKLGSENKFGSETYSEEELVAEMGSCFLLSYCGIDTENTTMNSAAYLKSWADVLKEKRKSDDTKKMIVHASSGASKAMEYILYGKVRRYDEEDMENVEEVEEKEKESEE